MKLTALCLALLLVGCNKLPVGVPLQQGIVPPELEGCTLSEVWHQGNKLFVFRCPKSDTTTLKSGRNSKHATVIEG